MEGVMNSELLNGKKVKLYYDHGKKNVYVYTGVVADDNGESFTLTKVTFIKDGKEEKIKDMPSLYRLFIDNIEII